MALSVTERGAQSASPRMRDGRADGRRGSPSSVEGVARNALAASALAGGTPGSSNLEIAALPLPTVSSVNPSQNAIPVARALFSSSSPRRTVVSSEAVFPRTPCSIASPRDGAPPDSARSDSTAGVARQSPARTPIPKAQPLLDQLRKQFIDAETRGRRYRLALIGTTALTAASVGAAAFIWFKAPQVVTQTVGTSPQGFFSVCLSKRS
jgi:hypothetical protein